MNKYFYILSLVISVAIFFGLLRILVSGLGAYQWVELILLAQGLNIQMFLIIYFSSCIES